MAGSYTKNMTFFAVLKLVKSGHRHYHEPVYSESSYLQFEDAHGNKYQWVAFRDGLACYKYKEGQTYAVQGRIKAVQPFRDMILLSNCKLSLV